MALHGVLVTGMRVVEIDICWGWWVFSLGLYEARLKMDDVLPQRVVLRLDGLVIVFQSMQFPNLLLELLDISFFALSKCTL